MAKVENRLRKISVLRAEMLLDHLSKLVSVHQDEQRLDFEELFHEFLLVQIVNVNRKRHL